MTIRILLSASLLALLAAIAPPAAMGGSIGGEYSCSSLTMTCQYRTVGFHQGLPGDQGQSTWGASAGACTILLTSCQSRDPVFRTTAWGTCMPAFASTTGLTGSAMSSGTMCVP